MSLRFQPCLRPLFHQLCRPGPPRARALRLRRPTLCLHQPNFHTGVRFHDNEPRSQDVEDRVTSSNHTPMPAAEEPSIRTFRTCPGCGAPAQVVETGIAGYYDTTRKVVRNYVKSKQAPGEAEIGDNPGKGTLSEALLAMDSKVIQDFQLNDLLAQNHKTTSAAPEPPLCDRCHDLVHHSFAKPIIHPSIDSLRDTMDETAYKHNHIYHVLDAADFPMSLVPRIHSMLDASPLRSKNRRARQTYFRHGRNTELSFVITRSDLLAPTREQVESLKPLLVSILRDALGSLGRDVRLGNVTCVSAKRGWRVRELKKEIWHRGGAGWMVGKVNVGKSNLYDSVFPKGGTEDIKLQALRESSRMGQPLDLERLARGEVDTPFQEERRLRISTVKPGEKSILEEETVLLPPARQETPYPIMPTVSSLPGTTASPIRIPFGDGKGELIDLPGLARTNFFDLVREEHQDDLVMKKRVVPEQYVIRSGQSLMLGGLIRITPVNQDLDFLAAPFITLNPHLTSTAKALEYESGSRSTDGIPVIIKDEYKSSLTSAGRFKLEWDVTKTRAGPLTSRSAGKLKTVNLPFQILSADILIEGVGWVEIAVQVRKRKVQASSILHTEADVSLEPQADNAAKSDNTFEFPEVEVFSPQGKFIDVRHPIGAWMLNKPLKPVKRSSRRNSGKPSTTHI